MKKEYQNPDVYVVEFHTVDYIMDVGDKEFSDGWEWDDDE